MGAVLVKCIHYGKTDHQLQSPISELNIDCLEEIFEWMSISDLLSFRRTCKRYKKAVDHFIRSYYPAIGTIRITENNLKKFLNLGTNTLIRKIIISIKNTSVKRDQIERIKGTLIQLEYLLIERLKFKGHFYDDFLKFCPNLIILHIEYCNILKVGTGNEWLLKRYPTLKIVVFNGTHGVNHVEEIEMKTFLKKNPNIQHFCITMDFFLKHKYLFCSTDFIFKTMNVHIDISSGAVFLKFLDFLNEYYKLLLSQKKIKFQWLIPKLNDFYMDHVPNVFPMLPDLNQFHFLRGNPMYLIFNTEIGNFKNITHVFLNEVNFDQVLPLIQYNNKLKYINIADLKEGIHFKNGIIDLKAINKERQKLTGACKIEITVEGKIYLATKHAMMATNFSLIELKPKHAYYSKMKPKEKKF